MKKKLYIEYITTDYPATWNASVHLNWKAHALQVQLSASLSKAGKKPSLKYLIAADSCYRQSKLNSKTNILTQCKGASYAPKCVELLYTCSAAMLEAYYLQAGKMGTGFQHMLLKQRSKFSSPHNCPSLSLHTP